MNRKSLSFIVALAALAFAPPAQAHSGFAGMSDFWNGALHLVLSIEQALTLLALGIVMARLETDGAEAPFHYFLAALATGLVAGTALLPIENDALRPAPMIAVGLLLVDPADRVKRAPIPLVALAAAITGLCFGSSVPADVQRTMFAGGMLLGAVLLPTYAMLLWERLYRPWLRIPARIAGSWLAAVGMILLGASFR